VSAGFVERTGAANPLAGQQLPARSAPSLGDLDGDAIPTSLRARTPARSSRSAICAHATRFPSSRVTWSSPLPSEISTATAIPDLVSGDLRYFEHTGSGAAAFVQRTGRRIRSMTHGYHPTLLIAGTPLWATSTATAISTSSPVNTTAPRSVISRIRALRREPCSFGARVRPTRSMGWGSSTSEIRLRC
jgi:hypothetical protein